MYVKLQYFSFFFFDKNIMTRGKPVKFMVGLFWLMIQGIVLSLQGSEGKRSLNYMITWHPWSGKSLKDKGTHATAKLSFSIYTVKDPATEWLYPQWLDFFPPQLK